MVWWYINGTGIHSGYCLRYRLRRNSGYYFDGFVNKYTNSCAVFNAGCLIYCTFPCLCLFLVAATVVNVGLRTTGGGGGGEGGKGRGGGGGGGGGGGAPPPSSSPSSSSSLRVYHVFNNSGGTPVEQMMDVLDAYRRGKDDSSGELSSPSPGSYSDLVHSIDKHGCKPLAPKTFKKWYALVLKQGERNPLFTLMPFLGGGLPKPGMFLDNKTEGITGEGCPILTDAMIQAYIEELDQRGLLGEVQAE